MSGYPHGNLLQKYASSLKKDENTMMYSLQCKKVKPPNN